MSDTKSTKATAGQTMLDHLRAKGKKARKAGTATTEELATVAGIPVKQAYDRLWWMEKKDGTLTSTGTGKARVWRSTPKVRKGKAESEAVADATEAVTLTPAEAIEA